METMPLDFSLNKVTASFYESIVYTSLQGTHVSPTYPVELIFDRTAEIPSCPFTGML